MKCTQKARRYVLALLPHATALLRQPGQLTATLLNDEAETTRHVVLCNPHGDVISQKCTYSSVDPGEGRLECALQGYGFFDTKEGEEAHFGL